MSSESARLRVKTWIFVTVVVLANVFGNFFLKKGLPADLPTPWSYITVLFHPLVTLGAVLLILWMISWMTLLSWADLSWVLPTTAIGYVLVALVGHLFLAEQISFKRWVGIVLIVGGVVLVSLGTPPRTHKPETGA